jgi:branched-chain amino acid transport system permease protein
MTGPRGRQLRARAAEARSSLAHYTGFDWARAHYRRLPSRLRNWLPFALLLTLALTYPFYVGNLPTNVPLILTFPDLHSAVTILVFVVMAVGLNIVVGYAGLLDLGYVAFYAIGAYTAGWLASGQFQQVSVHVGGVGIAPTERGIHINIWLVLLIAAMLTALGGILIGLPTLRLRGDYLAIVTLGFGEIIPQFVRNADASGFGGFDLTHGTFGISPIDTLGFGGAIHGALGLPIRYTDSFPPTPDRLFYWTALGILLFTIFCSLRLRDSRLGRAWIAIREDETAAGAMGIPLMRTKTWSYAIGAFFGGAAGAFVASFNQGAFPSQFDFNISVFLLCMVILGGMGSLWGVVLAGTILAWLNVEGLANIGTWINSNLLPSSHQIDVPKYTFGIYGVIIVLMMLFRPTGLIPERRRAREIQEGAGHGTLDDPLYETRVANEPGAGERGSPGRVPRG